jgi:hypothetical protein
MEDTMNRSFWIALALASTATATVAQTPAKAARAKAGDAATTSANRNQPVDLPVRKVVLYKNGVGSFEHAGTVTGTQKVSIDFTSAQLNDVLQSLTVLDEGGGRIGGVSYNSTTPIDQQLQSIGLGLQDYPGTIAVYHALRGQRVEVTGAGAPLIGRLVNVEFRIATDKENKTSPDHYFLIVATDAGALRTVELTDAVSVHMLDAALQKQWADYLRVISSSVERQARHLVFEDAGQSARTLRVRYISEVPVWKATYRLVFPREENGKATLQGWAVVDNTVGTDWNNVQLSLVAGAPQSFIQPLSEPLYVKRREVPIATVAQAAPETHEAALTGVVAPKVMAATPRRIMMAKESEAAGVGHGSGNGYGVGVGGNFGGGLYALRPGVTRPTDAFAEGDVATNAFDDFFEYTLAQPVTIRKNESAMVPILQQELPAEHVTLWHEGATPLRAVWLENASKLTLDSGSFSIFESGEFAGEGLLDPIHPGERRLLSYAADQAVRVRQTEFKTGQSMHHVSVQKGVIVETRMDRQSRGYSVTNSADLARTVMIEVPRVASWSLDDGLKAEETATDLYRFKLPVAAHATATLEVGQHGPEQTRIELNARENQTQYLLSLAQRTPQALAALQPVIDAQTAIAKLDAAMDASKESEETATADEARARENLTALKGNEAAKRFVENLNRAEDTLEAARKRTADLEAQKQTAIEKLDALIAGLSFDWDVREAAK